MPLPSSDTRASPALLRKAAREAAQRADEAGGDLDVVYAGIADAYAALDALYGHSCASELPASLAGIQAD